MDVEVVAEDIGTEDCAEGRFLFCGNGRVFEGRGRRRGGELGLGGPAGAVDHELRVGNGVDIVGEGFPNGLEPVDTCDAGDAGIENDGV